MFLNDTGGGYNSGFTGGMQPYKPPQTAQGAVVNPYVPPQTNSDVYSTPTPGPSGAPVPGPSGANFYTGPVGQASLASMRNPARWNLIQAKRRADGLPVVDPKTGMYDYSTYDPNMQNRRKADLKPGQAATQQPQPMQGQPQTAKGAVAGMQMAANTKKLGT